MKIGNWQATPELCNIYRQACELGLLENLAELEAFGFTVVEPEKVKADGLFERMLETVKAVCDEEDAQGKALNTPLGSKTDYSRMLHGLITRDPLFCEAVMHPVALTLSRYILGASCRLFTTSAFVKKGHATSTILHTDTAGTPPPLYPFGLVSNVSWILTDYVEDTGTFAMVPGSHRYCRHPTSVEQPAFMGGTNENICVPVSAAPGSLIVFNGNTWHGTYPKKSSEFRAHVVTGFCRNYILPAENFDDVSPSAVKKYGAELEHLLFRDTWQGYKTEGPRPGGLEKVWRANYAPSA